MKLIHSGSVKLIRPHVQWSPAAERFFGVFGGEFGGSGGSAGGGDELGESGSLPSLRFRLL